MLASELLSQVRLMGSITPDVSDVDLLLHADMEVQGRLLPLLRTINEEYLVRQLDAAPINGRIALPPRATGAAVRLVQSLTNGQLRTLPRVDPAADPGPGMVGIGDPWGFYFDGGGIVLLPAGASATIRVRYFARPGKLVLETGTPRRITTVTVGATTTALVLASAYGGSSPIDIISSGPAHQHVGVSVAYTGGPSTLTVNNSDLLETPQVGDYVAAPDTSPFVALPEELGSVLALRTAARALAALGYMEEASYQEGRADQYQREAEALLRPRSDGNPKRLTGGTLAQMGSNFIDGWRRW